VITLGSAGEDLTVIIPVGASYVATLTASTPWPTGTAIELHFMNDLSDVPVVWAATISGSDATFDIDTTQVQLVVDARLSIARLIYNPGGTGALLWAHGTARYV
jgi:hypothetical protein